MAGLSNLHSSMETCSVKGQSDVDAIVADLEHISPTKLNYDIYSWSSHSAAYHPRHILVDKPQDQSSRWSSGSNNQMQFITVKLENVSVLKTITFGKYHKIHVCNLKEFKVFVGMDTKNMIQVLHSGLRNDDEPETFSVKYKSNDVVIPCQYIKIVPLLAWGANFNFSIWYVEPRGVSDPSILNVIHQNYSNYKEAEVVRLCLKYFRQRGLLDTFKSLKNSVDVKLENEELEKLHDTLVIQGDFDQCENILQQASISNLFSEYISSCPYIPIWRKIGPNNGITSPPTRGGHQMCIDSTTGKIYLYGGWDGEKDLADFWVFDQDSNEWTCISDNTASSFGPGPRSCHKIDYDERNNCIYTLGRYVDQDVRMNVNLDNDFWKYDVKYNSWSKISSNVVNEGGPQLLYDHQMVIDSEEQKIYVFGGRTISQEPSLSVNSGLYVYDIALNKWKILRSDDSQLPNTIQLKSRIGHSMLLNPDTKELYIFAGQRNKDYLSDFYVYNIKHDTVKEISRDYSKQGGPDAGFTQRATIEPDTGEIFVLSGLMREKNAVQESVKNSFWVYSIKQNKWSKIYQKENTGSDNLKSPSGKEPPPRFAHQLVYDHKRKKQFLFGGNPGSVTKPKLRLNDFWELDLIRPNNLQILQRAVFKIRRQRFLELSLSSPPNVALKYLRENVFPVVDQNDPVIEDSFRQMTRYLFNKANIDIYNSRTVMYQELLEYFPKSMREPCDSILDLVKFQ